MLLVLDHFDSFTHNLVHLIETRAGPGRVIVHRSDSPHLKGIPLSGIEAVILSPGPGHPESERPARDLLRRLDREAPRLPVLGVCLGMQILALHAGGRIGRLERPYHGFCSRVRHAGLPLFEGLPQGFRAMRYHSLHVLEDSLRDPLVATAWSEDDGVLMGIRWRNRPWYGVQHHPESFLSEGGERMIDAFLEHARR